jgi:hypothetical protein
VENLTFIAAETYIPFCIPIIPLGQDKNPLIGSFALGKPTVRHSHTRFPELQAFGVPDSRLSGRRRRQPNIPARSKALRELARCALSAEEQPA